jgi:hypothetical protein
MAKGQAEFVVIVGILIVASVAVIYAYQSGLFTGSDVPPAIQAKYDSVKASFESLVREGVQDTMRRMSQYGGYLDNSSFQMGSVTFLGKEVPYWELNGEVKYPDVKNNFLQGVQSYVSANKQSMLDSLKISGVQLGNPDVKTSFLASKITLTVTMPTTIDGTRVSKPYVIEVQSRLSEIDDFSKGFASYQKASRPLEYYTISSMVLSPIEEDVHAVPVYVSLTDCGGYVFKSWWDVKPQMEQVIKATLANVYMPGKAPTDFIMTSSSPKYSLVPIGGKKYENLEVDFQVPDNFQLTQSDFQFTPDPISATSQIIPMVGICMSDPVYVKYYASYPAIVRVKDPLTQNVFQFAVHVYIKDNLPGEWSSLQGYQSDAQKQICSNYQCAIDIAVKDTASRPLDSAEVMFMGCSLGRTGSTGRLTAAAPCGIGPLQIFKLGYSFPARMESSDSIRSLTVSLVKTPVIRVHFYEAVVQNLSLIGKYQINKDDIRPIADNQNIYMTLYGVAEDKLYERGFNTKASTLSNMPAGTYLIAATLYAKELQLDGSTSLKELGAIILNYDITESLDGKDLYVYMPSSIGYKQMTDETQKGEATIMLTSLLDKCGLGPMLASQPNFEGCSWGYNEV